MQPHADEVAENERLRKRIAELEASVATLREALEEMKAEYEGAGMHDDERKTTYKWSLTRIAAALANPAATEALERVRRGAKKEMFDEIVELYFNLDFKPFNEWLRLKATTLRGVE